MKKTWAQNIKKFLFEVIIVTLGILVAFNINKWDEKNKQQTEEIEAYKSLKDDLNTDLYVLNYYKRFHKDAKSYLKPILENNFEHVDSLGAYLKVAFDLQEGNPTYVNLKYSGKFGILKNPEIKSKVVLYYETYYQGLENISEIHSNLIYNKIDPYLIENFKFNMTSDDLQNSLKEDEFLNLIAYQYVMLESNLVFIDKCENLINNTLEEINIELNIKKTDTTSDRIPTEDTLRLSTGVGGLSFEISRRSTLRFSHCGGVV